MAVSAVNGCSTRRLVQTAVCFLLLRGEGAFSEVTSNFSPTTPANTGSSSPDHGKTLAIIMGALLGTALILLIVILVIMSSGWPPKGNQQLRRDQSETESGGSQTFLFGRKGPSRAQSVLETATQVTAIENLSASASSHSVVVVGEDVIIDRAVIASPPTPKEVIRIQAFESHALPNGGLFRLNDSTDYRTTPERAQPYEVVSRHNVVQEIPQAHSEEILLHELHESSNTTSQSHSRETTLNRPQRDDVQPEQLVEQIATRERLDSGEVGYDGCVWAGHDPKLHRKPDSDFGKSDSIPSHSYENVSSDGVLRQVQTGNDNQMTADPGIPFSNPDYDEQIPFGTLAGPEEAVSSQVMRKRPVGRKNEKDVDGVEDDKEAGTPVMMTHRNESTASVGLDVLLFHTPLSELEDDITVSDSFVDFGFLQSMDTDEPGDLDRSNVEEDLEQLGQSMDTLAKLNKKEKKKAKKLPPSVPSVSRDIPSAMDIFANHDQDQLDYEKDYLNQPVFQSPEKEEQTAGQQPEERLVRERSGSSLFINLAYRPKGSGKTETES